MHPVLNDRIWDDLFPFAITFDDDLRIVALGPSLSKLIPEATAGAPLADHFELHRPNRPLSRQTFSNAGKHLFVLREKSRDFMLRGQIVTDSSAGLFYFVGSPWVRDVENLKQLGLNVNDYAVHDGTIDYLLALSLKTLALAERQTEIMARMKAQENSEAQFRQAARIAHLGHWRADEQKGVYTTISEEYARIHGYSVDEYMERYRNLNCDWENIHPEDQARVKEIYNREDDAELEFRIIHRDTSVRHVREIYRSTRDDSGTLLACEGTLQDTTDLKQSEFELRKAKNAAEAANQAKSAFLSRMSHELRTPMNAILGFGQLLQMLPEEQLKEKQPRFVQHILKAGRHLLALIDEVLDLARIDSGRMQLLMESVDPGEVLQNCINRVQSMLDKHKITLDIQLKPGSAPNLWADKTLLQQVLLNLLSNAVKYNHAGGRVTVGCEEIADGLLRINIIDTGPGIPKERMDELFEPFERLGAEQSEVEGAGIGLTITKRLVEMMGGQLGVESTPSKGSTFWVEFRTDRGASAEPRPHAVAEVAVPDSDEASYQALYIEDDPASLELMQAIINRQPLASLLAAPNAELGLQIARSERPDIIFMDINLPGMDGFQALQALKEDEATRDIPVIAISAGAKAKDIEHVVAVGFFDYLIKPLDLRRFQATLDLALAAVPGTE